MKLVIDVDDLINRQQIIAFLVPLWEQVPEFKLTAYTIPNRMGEVHDLKREFPWVTFAIHGFEHTHYECMSWSESNAHYFIETALNMGYAPLFKPPNWEMDFETEKALQNLGVTLHHHTSYSPSTSGLKVFPGLPQNVSHDFNTLHTHILKNPVTDFIEDHPGFKAEGLKLIEEFLSPMDRATVCE